ncbi:MAG: guanylate cyclase [Spirochaetaceae bacterium]|nr:MAG: guanylate cyclase [Spirochaetaceae bacterium]
MRHPARFFCAVLLTVVVVSTTVFADGPFGEPEQLGDPAATYRPGRSVRYLEDIGGAMTAADAVNTGLWRRSERTTLNFGFTSSVYWLSLPLENTTSQTEWYVQVAYPLHDSIQLYLVDPAAHAAPVLLSELGHKQPFETRPVFYRNFVFPVDLTPGGTGQLLFRFETGSAVDIPLIVQTPGAFERQALTEQILMGIYFGAMFIMLVYNLFLLAGLRTVSYLYYSLFILFYVLFQASINGYAAQYLWSTNTWWADASLPFLIAGGTFWCLVFNRRFLDTPVTAPLFDKVLLGLMAVCGLNGVLAFTTPYAISIRIATIVNLLAFLVILLNSGSALIRGNHAARIYFPAWVTFLTGTMIFALKSLGVLPTTAFTTWAGSVGSVIVVVLLSLALADQFNLMRQERTAALSALNVAYGRFVPMEFLELLKKDSILDIKLGDQIQRESSILFSDIRSFTALSESMTPEENFNFLNSYLSRISPIIRTHRGFIDKYIGDAIMALFPHSPTDAVRASVEIRRELWEFNRRRYEAGKEPIEIGIGIHCGMVMLGTIGELERIDGTVIADAVNLASRLEGITKVFGSAILISKEVYDKIGTEHFSVRYLGKTRLYGKNLETEIYEVMDGFDARITELKARTVDDFREGIRLYFEKEFQHAAQRFERVLEIDPKDRASTYYLSRCTHYLDGGTGAEFDGTETFLFK